MQKPERLNRLVPEPTLKCPQLASVTPTRFSLNRESALGNIGGAIASGATGTPPPTAPPLGKGRMGNVAGLEMQQLMSNRQLANGAIGVFLRKGGFRGFTQNFER